MWYDSLTMNVHLGHLSNYIQGPSASTVVRSMLDDARKAGKRAPRRLPERKLAVRLSDETVAWLGRQAEEQGCAMAEIVRACIADRAVSELTALYQQHTTSPAEFSAALWSVLGYEPESSPGEEICRST